MDEATWEGIALGELAEDCSLSHLTMEGAGDLAKGAISVDDAPLHLDHVTVNGSAKAGVYLKGTGQFTEDTQALVVTGAREPVSIDISQGHTVPGEGSDYTGNTQDTINLRGSELHDSAHWTDLGVPFLVEEVAEVSGTAGDPAILTIDPGVTVLFAKSAGLAMSKDGGASALVAEGSTELPITFGPLGANEPGYWRGIELYNGVEQASLAHAEIAWAGAGTSRGALTVHSCTATLQHLTLRNSEDAGLALRGTGRLSEDSSGLLVYDNEVAVKTWAGGVGDLPSSDSSYAGNASDVISIEESGEIPHSATWPDLGLPYSIDEDLLVEGSSEEPAVLTLVPGLELQFANNTGLFVSKVGGAAGLVAEGTEEAPIELGPRDSNAAGAWAGVGFYNAAEDASCSLAHVHISGGGGKTLKGNVHLKEVDASLVSVVVDNSLEWGVYVEADTTPESWT